MKLDIDFLKQHHSKIHFFGLGFVQLKLDANMRMHFYHPELMPIVGEEEIHNHRYDFISTILAGKLHQQKYHVHFDITAAHEMVYESCTAGEEVDPQPVSVMVRPVGGLQTYTCGESYTIHHNEFHTVDAEFAITRLYRGAIQHRYASVVRPKNAEKVCPFSKTLSDSECWQIIEDCLKRAACEKRENYSNDSAK